MSEGINKELIVNARKPEGDLGLEMIEGMNLSHAAMTKWALDQINVKVDETILDVGCGGGKAVEALSKLASQGKVYGIDYSKLSVKEATKVNLLKIQQGVIEIREASVSHLPFPDQFFDLITGIETIYFWPDLDHDMAEVLRVLKPGGRLAIICEMVKSENSSEKQKAIIEFMKMHYHSKEEFQALFLRSGYKKVSLYADDEKGWVCVVGWKEKE